MKKIASTEVRSFLLTPHETLKYWHLVSDDIDQALAYGVGEITSFEICKQALNGHIQIWIVLDSNDRIICTASSRILQYENKAVLQIITLTSRERKLDTFLDQHHAFIDFAKANQCSGIQVWGRKGWNRKLAQLNKQVGSNYKPLYTVFHSEI